MKEDTKMYERLMELIETTTFEELTEVDRSMVLEVTTEQAYRAQRELILQLKDWEEEVISEPLVLPNDRRTATLLVPWYAAVAGMAAAFLIGMWFFKSKSPEVTVEAPIAKVDTVYIEKELVDTIIETKYKVIHQKEAKPILDNQPSLQKVVLPNPARVNEPNFSVKYLKNTGVSVQNDETFALIEGLQF